MRISKLTLSNFRCFGPDRCIVELDSLTTLIGSNGTGKTAVLAGLLKMFGGRPSDRLVEVEDFFLTPGAQVSDLESRSLWIEVKIDFNDPTTGNGVGIAECFRQMSIDGPDGSLYCRIRLEASWTRSATSGGEVDQTLYWIVSPDDEPAENTKKRVTPQERANIGLIYVPASRDPGAQLRQVSGSLLHPLLKAIEWNEETRGAASQAASQVRNAVRGEPAVGALEQAITASWNRLQNRPNLQAVQLNPLDSDFDALVKRIEAVFSQPQTPAAGTQPLERLSDGLRSLFYFSLVSARFELEQQTVEAGDAALFDLDVARLPLLTMFAIEEPENHLAPHYLSRILALLDTLTKRANAQVLLTSQSPSVLGRVEPENVRHLQLDVTSGHASARRLLLPPAGEDEGEVFKYVKEAVRAHPELYFSKVVILGEGDSEEVVLPRVARVLGQSFDQTFISMVPLGGRHVNHFWRLLNDLQIAHITLLDFDRERHGGGWARIKYATEQLVKFRTDLTLASFNQTEATMLAMGNQGPAIETHLTTWLNRLEEHHVFFSGPLDLDFMLLEAFPEQYKLATSGRGPNFPTDEQPRAERIKSAGEAVLKPEGGDGSTYTDAQKELFVWYQYLFLGRGKPVTHLRAMNALETDPNFVQDMPAVLKRLVGKALTLSGVATNGQTA